MAARTDLNAMEQHRQRLIEQGADHTLEEFDQAQIALILASIVPDAEKKPCLMKCLASLRKASAMVAELIERIESDGSENETD